MRVAVLHYHLRRGGVTRVIETAYEALREHDVELLVLAGEAPPELDLPAEAFAVIPGLGYREDFNLEAAGYLKQQVEAAAQRHWGAPPDIWHVHNHSLAKNLEVPWMVSRWAEEGRRLLLQPHDFAEDGRPANYLKLQELTAELYPVGPNVLYGLLNSRDRELLNRAGVPTDQTVPLPNAVRGFATGHDPINPQEFGAEKLILYPSRSIRRKNLGEVLLHAAVADEGTRLGCTLAPENPTALPIYERWTAVADELGLPVEFNLGPRSGASLESMLAGSEAIITTSVAEGFGLAFLEPWLANRPLVGRNLPDITGDFSELGVDLSALYETLPVPVEWVGEKELQDTYDREVTAYFEAYQRPCDDLRFDRDTIDFGKLSETLQENVISRVLNDSDARERVASLQLSSPETIAANRRAVAENFGVGDYGQRLAGYYQRLLEAPMEKVDWLDPNRLLDEFLDPARFNLLRT
ncbi:MAG: glycosyltransferase family 4 protein [Limisphaerales bacterium]